MTSRYRAFLLLSAVVLLVPSSRPGAVQAPATQPSPLDAVINALTFRNIGPFRTAAWVTEVAVPETPARDHLYTMYAATRSGGLWKTTNAGTTSLTRPARVRDRIR